MLLSGLLCILICYISLSILFILAHHFIRLCSTALAMPNHWTLIVSMDNPVLPKLEINIKYPAISFLSSSDLPSNNSRTPIHGPHGKQTAVSGCPLSVSYKVYINERDRVYLEPMPVSVSPLVLFPRGFGWS